MLESNGAIKVYYFFIKNKIVPGDLEDKYCPTKKLWEDILNKQKQASNSRKSGLNSLVQTLAMMIILRDCTLTL